MNTAARIAILCVVLFMLALTFGRAYRSWHNDPWLDPASGSLAALAMDFKDGVFYRPLFGPDGYGGTRYQPLRFVLHAELWRLTGDFRSSGYALNALTALVLLGGVYHLQRKLGAARSMAFLCSGLLLTTDSLQLGLLGFHPDTLAVAMEVWALTLCVGPTMSAWAMGGAALLFTLAFSAKLTSVAGVIAALLAFYFAGRRRDAWKLLVATLVGCLLAALIFNIASHGRWLEIMRACVTGGAGGSDYLRILISPFSVAWNALYRDQSAVGFLLLGWAALFTWPKGSRKEIAPLFFVVAWAVTGLTLVSPGTSTNHELLAVVPALVLLPVWLERSEPQRASLGLAALAVASVFALPPQWFRFSEWDIVPARARAQQALRLIADTRKPILSENPIIPMMAGQRPYMLDGFMLRVIRQRDPSFAEPLWQALREQAFSGIVVTEDPLMPMGRAVGVGGSPYDEQMYSRMEQTYQQVARYPREFVFLPLKR